MRPRALRARRHGLAARENAAQPAYCLGDPLLVLDEREAHVTLPVHAEPAARADGDVRLAQQAQDFAVRLLKEAHVAVSPGRGVGADGEGYVRFALVETEQRIAQAVRGMRGVLS